MPDLGRILDRESTTVDLGPDAFESLLRRRDVRQRRQRVVAAVFVLLLIGGLAAAALSVMRNQTSKPASSDLTSDTVASLQTLWTYQAGGILAPPAAGDGIVATVSKTGRIVVLPARCRTDGFACQPSWTADVGTMPTNRDPLGQLAGPVFVGGYGGPNQPDRSSPLVIADGILYTVGDHGRVFAFATTCRSDGGACAPLWTGPPIPGTPSAFDVGDGTAYLAIWGGTQEGLYAFRGCPTDGSVCQPAWHLLGTWLFQVRQGTVYATDTSTGTAAQLDPATGRAIWTGGPGGKCCGNRPVPMRSGDSVYVDFGHQLWAFPASCTGPCAPTWVGDIPDRFSSGPVVAGGGVTVTVATDSNTSGVLTFPLGCATGGATCTTSHRTEVGAELTTVGPVVADGLVVAVSTRAAGVFAFDPACLVAQDACPPRWSAFVSTPDQPITENDVAFVGDIRTGPIDAFATTCRPQPVPSFPNEPARCLPAWSSDYTSVGQPAVLEGVVYGTDVDGVVHASGFPEGGPTQIGQAAARPEAPAWWLLLAVAVVAGLAIVWTWYRRRRMPLPRMR